MGAGVSTEGAPLSEVAIKNEIGVLYDAEKKKAFDAAATEGPDGTRVADWPTIEAHAKAHDERTLDPRKCMYHNLKGFKAAREQIDELARVHIKGAVKEIPWRGKDLSDDARQRGPDGAPAKTLEDLYAIAKDAREEYTKVMTAACADSVPLRLAPLKGRERAAAKARDEYKDKAEPFVSWLFDVVRGSVLCETEADIVRLYEALEANPSVEVVRIKNRFNPPNFNGYRDVLMNVAVKVGSVSHLCELQIHLKAIKDSEPMHKSHLTYEFFRSYFLGNADAVEDRLKLLMALPVDDAKDVDELVDLMLGSDQYAGQLDGLCELLESIHEFAGVVKVQEHILAEHILAEKERVFGTESKEAGEALHELGNAYWRLGDSAKHRDALERALPIYEHEYGKDSTKVAALLTDLGNAHNQLGDYAKARDVLERALAINERAHGHNHPKVATTLGTLGTAYGQLGDDEKKREVLERALAIQERVYGRDHTSVAITLNRLGFAYNSLGEYAKAHEMLERALAIDERAYGRDSTQVSITLTNLGDAVRALGDPSKAVELLGRALAIKESALGKDHVRTAYTLMKLGKACCDLGDAAKARDSLQRAIPIFEGANNSTNAEWCRNMLASCLGPA